MKKLILMFFDITFLKFLIIGGCNFILSMGVMIVLYNSMGFGYWGASIISFSLCSIISYILNRKISFKSNAPLMLSIIKFSIVIAVSYFTAFGLAKVVIVYFVELIKFNCSYQILEQLAMILAQCIFTVINFVGQRLWTFKDTSNINDDSIK